jgi:hypothetical protein
MRTLAAIACALLVAAAAPAWADVGPDGAAAIAQRMAGGRVLAVVYLPNRGVWRVKLVTGRGEVRIVFIDAASGRPV